MGRSIQKTAAHRCRVRAGRRSGPHAAKTFDETAGKANGEFAWLSSARADVGLAAELHSGMAGRVSRHPQNRTARLVDWGGVRAASPSDFAAVARARAATLPRPALP